MIWLLHHESAESKPFFSACHIFLDNFQYSWWLKSNVKSFQNGKKQFFQQLQRYFRIHICETSVVEGLKNLSWCWKANRFGMIPDRQSPREVDSGDRGVVWSSVEALQSWGERVEQLLKIEGSDKNWRWCIFGRYIFSMYFLPVDRFWNPRIIQNTSSSITGDGIGEWLPGGTLLKGWPNNPAKVGS